MSISYCKGCQKKHNDNNWKYTDGWYCSKWFKPSKYPEFIPEQTKKDREKFARDIIQPWREGEPSLEFMKVYPEKAKKMFSKKEQAKAKPVWRDLPGLKDVQGTR